MKLPFNPPVVKHDIEFIKTLEPNAQGEMVEKRIVRISGPPLPGIEIPYNDPNLPNLLQRYSLTEVLNQPTKQPEKLWGNYWQSGQLCILAGDMGTGKSTVAIRLARELASPQPLSKGEGLIAGSPPAKEGNELHSCEAVQERGGGFEVTANGTCGHPLPHANGVSTPPSQGESRLLPKKVLFIGFELSGADMKMRYGDGEVSENLFYANLNADAFATGRANLGERLVTSLDDMVVETEAQVVIIDQPDRMHLQPAMWNYFMLKLNALKVQKGVSVLITLNNKPRNLSKAPTISSLYKSNLLAPHADSIVSIANHCRAEGKRYIKLLKNTSQPLGENALPEVLEIVVKNNYPDIHRRDAQNNHFLLQPPTILSVQACGTEREEKVLQPTATERRNARMISAEEMRRQGMNFRDIAQAMELPERTVRSWVYFIGARDQVLGARENNTHPVTPLACHPSQEGILKSSPPAKEGNESRHQRSSGERGGDFGLLQPEHVATPSLTPNGVSTPP
jgi:hypothetical protein